MGDLKGKLETALGHSYVFERELGGGGMSRVFLAHDRALDRPVVLKVLPEEMAAEVNVERFRREIQLAAKLQHPHVVPVLSTGIVDGTPYFSMPFVNGESLRARMTRDGELPVTDATRILRQVASALDYAHRQGVVHRDIKPDNVMLQGEFALVTDFGVAKALKASAVNDESGGLTGFGVALGTPAYMSPEQATADPMLDHRSDIYSFGVMAYEMLTGTPLFAGRSPQVVAAAHAVQPPEPIEKRRPGLSQPLASLVMRCLAKRPADRPQSATELLQILDGLSTAASAGIAATATGPGVSSKSAALAAAAVLLVGIVAYGAYSLSGSGESEASSGEFSSIAVLPLVNVGGDTAGEYFSDGMTDELANALTKLPGLRVASRTSAYAFKDKKDVDVGEIGRRLKVQAVLEGTVRREGDRLRVTTQLTNVSDGLGLWSDSFEKQARDVFQVQDEIAKSVAQALQLKLGSRASELSSTSRGTTNLAAYDSYLRGRHLWNNRGADNLRSAIAYFENAISRDPKFGRAYAALAIAFALLPEYTDSPPSDVLARTQRAAEMALSLDSTLAEAHTARGLASVHAWDFAAAGRSYRRALALEPRYPTAHQWYGELLYTIGRVDSSLAEIRIAGELDPLAPITAAALGHALTLARRYKDAIVETKKGIELAPGSGIHHIVLGRAYLLDRQFKAGVREMELARRLDPELALREGYLAHAYAVAGQRDKALGELERLTRRRQTERVPPVAFALAHLGLGDNDKTLTALEQAVHEHDISLLTSFPLLLDPGFDPLRGDPRFSRILERMNLASYGRRQ